MRRRSQASVDLKDAKWRSFQSPKRGTDIACWCVAHSRNAIVSMWWKLHRKGEAFQLVGFASFDSSEAPIQYQTRFDTRFTVGFRMITPSGAEWTTVLAKSTVESVPAAGHLVVCSTVRHMEPTRPKSRHRPRSDLNTLLACHGP